MLLAEALPIAGDDNAQSLHDKLAVLGAQLIVRALREQPAAVAQDNARATYAAKISRSEAQLDWNSAAADLSRAIRAFNPVPGAYTDWHGQPLKLWRAEPVSAATATPGTVLRADAAGIVVATGEGALCLLELQRAGGKRLAAQQFLAGTPILPGERLGA
jgi:methionyl-tRNA formyltransferase